MHIAISACVSSSFAILINKYHGIKLQGQASQFLKVGVGLYPLIPTPLMSMALVTKYRQCPSIMSLYLPFVS